VARRLAPLLVLALVLAACGGTSTETFEDAGAPFTFSYPQDLTRVFADTGREIQGVKPDYKIALGTNETNVVVVAQYTLAKDVSKLKPAALSVAVERSARALARALQGSTPKRSDAQLGDLPATQFEFTTRNDTLTTRLIYAFQGKRQYFVRCQWNADGKDAIPGACDEVAKTLKPAG
jgi:hypothetical protein